MIILKGFRNALPPTFKIWKEKDLITIEGSVCFDENCHYDHPGTGDADDWNKLTGYSFHIWNARKRSAMISWASDFHLDPNNPSFVLGGYFHDPEYNNRVAYSHPTNPIARVVANERTSFLLQSDLKRKQHIAYGDLGEFVQPFHHDRRRVRMINGWFGGNVKNDKTRTRWSSRLIMRYSQKAAKISL